MLSTASVLSDIRHLRTFKDCKHGTKMSWSQSDGTTVQIPVKNGWTVTDSFYKNYVLSKVDQKFNQKHRGVCLRHDNAAAHKCS